MSQQAHGNKKGQDSIPKNQNSSLAPKQIMQSGATASAANHKTINLMEMQKHQQKQQHAQEMRQAQKSANQSTKIQSTKSKMRFINKRNSQQPTTAKIEARKQENGRQQAEAVLRPQVLTSK